MSNTKILASEFEYFEPHSVNRALFLINKFGKQSVVLAGGTDLLVKMKKGEIEPRFVVNIMRIKRLNNIKEEKGLTIGATTPLCTIEKSKKLEKYYALYEGVKALGKVQVRNMGTIGGNICNASPAADIAPPLLVLSAQLKISNYRGSRNIPLNQFFKSPGQTVLSPYELLTEIHLPSVPRKAGSSFLKISRVSADLSKLNAAAFLERDGQKCKSCKIALGAVGPTPLRVKRAEDVLNGEKINAELMERAAQVVSEEIKPITDVRSTSGYRRTVSKVLTEEVLKIAWKRSGG